MSSVTPSMRNLTWLAQEHIISPQAFLKECHQGVINLHSALIQLDRAGTHLTECLALALHNTAYRCVGEVLSENLSSVFSLAVSNSSMSILKEMEVMLVDIQNSDQHLPHSSSYEQSLCHISLLLTKLKKEYFALCHSKMADIVHSLLCLKGEDEVTKLVLKLGLADGYEMPRKSNASLPNTPWGSPKTKKIISSDATKSNSRSGFRLMSLFERKSTDEKKSYADEMKPDTKDSMPTVLTSTCTEDSKTFLHSTCVSSGTELYSNSQMNCQESIDLFRMNNTLDDNPDEQIIVKTTASKPELASEEELQNVINLLSGMGCGSVSSMQVIPEIVPPQGPMQLTVPQIYCMPSPSSDTQEEDLRTQKTQVHRRSEGCLDLSSVNGTLWPHQQQHHHRASLPSVQLYSASGHKSALESTSPVTCSAHDSLFPYCHSTRDLTGPSYFRADPPSPFLTHYANNLVVGLNAGSNMLSPLQWAPGSATGLSNNNTGGSHSRLWSTSAGISPFSAGSGLQDSSDLSDDSSIEDQFFAVGKDLSSVIHSKNGSSDEDIHHDIHKSSTIWQSSNLMRGLTPDLLVPPDLYNTHRPIQMQWSDPLSSRSMWENSAQDINKEKTSQSMQGIGGVQ